MEYIIRDSKFVRDRYPELIGARVRKLLLFEEKGEYLVRLISFPKESIALRPFEKDSYLVRLDDLEPVEEESIFTSEAVEEEQALSSPIAEPFVGQLVHIGEQYADPMKYRAYVGAEAVILEIRSCIVQVYILSANQDIVERVLDVHLADIWSKPVELVHPSYLLVHRRDEFFYHTQDRELALDCLQRLKTTPKYREYAVIKSKDVTDFIGDKGYLALDMKQLSDILAKDER